MKRIHPKSIDPLVVAALAVLLGVAGCRNQSGGMANPFLAPDRVPPPATRAIMPGQAQPYYPGDPLPVMQSSTETSTNVVNGLTWTAPNGSSPQVAATATGPEPTLATAAAPEPTLATEAMVAIPTDGDPLRFALPPPAELEPMQTVATPPMPTAVDVQNQAVMQASYNEPQLASAETMPVSPWRAPQIVQPTLPPPPVAPPIIAQPTFNAVPLATTPVAMDVRLRAVNSSGPSETSSPRIRMPGDVVPQAASIDGFRPRTSMR